MTKQEAIETIRRNIQTQIDLYREARRLASKRFGPDYSMYEKAHNLYRINNKLMMKHNIVSIGRKVLVDIIGTWECYKWFNVPVDDE